MTDEKEKIYEILLTYLLFERREETEVRNAFATLVQERHVTFHDKEGETTDFITCSNQVCITALQLLQAARKPRVELSPLSLQLIDGYKVIVHKDTQSKTVSAHLEEPSTIKPPDKGLILKV